MQPTTIDLLVLFISSLMFVISAAIGINNEEKTTMKGNIPFPETGDNIGFEDYYTIDWQDIYFFEEINCN